MALSNWANRNIKWLFILPAALFVAVMMIFPILYTLRLSLYRWSGSNTDPPQWVGLNNYTTLLSTDPRFTAALVRTFEFTIGAVAVELILGVAIALLLRGSFRGQHVVKTLILLPMVATPVAMGMAWLLMFEPTIGFANAVLQRFHIPAQGWLADTNQALPSLMLVDVWEWTPMIALIALAGLATLPEEPIEAARVDGANAWQRFIHITLPLLAPTLVVATLLRAIDALKTFDIIYTMTQGGPGFATETLNIYSYTQGFGYFQLGMASSLLEIFFAIVLAVSLVFSAIRNRWGTANE
ncbi:MAG TPA: sugar ABC transporter permease [Chloroflexia bacterium]|nr:sugar ABC transporter permease [Chloroflexia bacterium]